MTGHTNHPTVSKAKPYALRFVKIYLALVAVATIAWLIIGVALMPDLVFDWFLGPVYVGTSIHMALTSTAVIAGAVVVFAAGVTYERWR